MLYPLSYECLPVILLPGFPPGLFGPVGVARTTLHDLRRDAKSISHTGHNLGKSPPRRSCGRTLQGGMAGSARVGCRPEHAGAGRGGPGEPGASGRTRAGPAPGSRARAGRPARRQAGAHAIGRHRHQVAHAHGAAPRPEATAHGAPRTVEYAQGGARRPEANAHAPHPGAEAYANRGAPERAQLDGRAPQRAARAAGVPRRTDHAPYRPPRAVPLVQADPHPAAPLSRHPGGAPQAEVARNDSGSPARWPNSLVKVRRRRDLNPRWTVKPKPH